MLWFFLWRTSYAPLFTDLRPADAATIVADLEQKKIPYRLANGGTTILVPEDAVDGSRLSVMTEDLPLKGTVGFELFNKSDMGLTDFAQKINYQRALQGELERTIMTLDGIDSARVHLSLGEDRIFRDDRVPPKASVTIRMQKGAVLSVNAAQGIQRLIAAAVAGLGVGDVVILDEKGRVVGPSAPSLTRDVVPPLVQEEKAIEDYYEARVRQALERAYPQEHIGVTVVADLAASADTTTLPEWNPAARTFPLEIALASASTLDSASQEIVRGAVTAAIGSDATTNDTVVFGIQATASESDSSAASAPSGARRGNDRSTVLPESSSEYDSLSAVGAALTLVMLILLAVVLISRLRRPRRLTAEQRNAFAAKLRSILERGDNNVAAPS